MQKKNEREENLTNEFVIKWLESLFIVSKTCFFSPIEIFLLILIHGEKASDRFMYPHYWLRSNYC